MPSSSSKDFERASQFLNRYCSIWLATGLWRNPVPICNDIQGERIVWATPKSSFQSQQGHCKDRCNGTYRSFLYESQSRCFLLWLFLDLCGKGEGCQLKPICQTLCTTSPVGRYHVSRMDPQVGSLWRRTISWPPCCKPFVGFSRSGKLGNWALEDSIDTIILFQSFEVRLICAANVFPLWSSPPSLVALCWGKKVTQHSWSKWCTNWTSELRTNRESRITS